jgi:integrase
MAVIKKNDSWWIDIYLNGRRVRRKVGPDKRTAQLVEKDLKVKAARGEWLGIEEAKRITFESFCDEFLKKMVGKAPSTYSNYELACRLHLKPFFKGKYLSSIRAKDVDEFVHMRAHEAKPNTVNRELTLIKTLYHTAMKWGYVAGNPAKDIPRLRIPEMEPPYLTRDQVASLYPHCKDWFYTFVAIALNTGLRMNEIRSLTWDDVDLRDRVIKIRSDEDFTTKGRKNRELPISEFLYQVLRKAPRHIRCPYVIFTKEGVVPWENGVRKRFRTARKRAGLPHFRIHDFRHTFGTLLAAEGVDVVTIKNLLGHANLKTTMRYLHAAPDRNKWAVENLRLDGTTQAEMDREKGRNDELQAKVG